MFYPHHVSHVTCHMSRVTCHVSRVTCQVSHVRCQMFFFFGQNGRASRWRVCYQRGLPRLVNWLIHSFSNPFPPDLQITFPANPKELGSWNFDRMFTLYQVSHVRCQVSRVRCQLSYVRCRMSCHIFFLFFFGQSGGGSVINGAYPVYFQYKWPYRSCLFHLIPARCDHDHRFNVFLC